ncbi:carbohydrate ABC transporter permease [Amphibiibacter pelophylacis]|uniref:Carbohydrate ABC transporter permease n=1 Tax=Amphibiibacter pelophylacis TaxID=1799477 RepID=A0ACC6P3H8_9BURK
MNKRLAQFGQGLAMVALALIILVPIYWVLSAAFKNYVDVYGGRWLFTPTLDNFRKIMEPPYLIHLKFLNSLAVAVGTVVITMPLAVLAAYSFSRFQLRGEKTMMVIILATQFLPGIVIVLPYFLLFRDIGLYDNLFGLILVNISVVMPFAVWMMKGFIDNIPLDIEESALVDGATRWQVIWHHVLPIARPGLITAAVFGFILTWNDFNFSVILTSKDAVTLPVGMALFSAEEGDLWHLISATGVLVMIPMFLFASIIQKHLSTGTAGAVR